MGGGEEEGLRVFLFGGAARDSFLIMTSNWSQNDSVSGLE